MTRDCSPAPSRKAELATSLASLDRRIGAVAATAGRVRGDVTLIAVTKTYPAADADLLMALGVTDLGENRVEELRNKAATVAGGGRWHFIGQLQTNKVNQLVAVPGLAAVHSVDRLRLVDALARAVSRYSQRPEPLDCFVQVDLDGAAAGRGGAAPTDVPALADAIASTGGLRLAGLMAVAPRHADPATAFASLATLSAQLQADHPGATSISAGMSGDLDAAITHGATHVRVGAALLGQRDRLR